MAKFIITFCALIACAAAKPGLVSPIAPVAYSAPLVAATHPSLAYSAPLVAAAHHPLAYSAPLAAPFAYANAPLDAAYSSSRVDIKQNYNAAILPATFAAVAPAKIVAPAAAVAAAPVAPFAAVAPVATPLKYTAAAPVFL